MRAIDGKSLASTEIFQILQVDGDGDEAIARAAARQRGLVHRRQLLDAGIGRGAITHRLQRGTLHCVLPRVYAVGHPELAPLVRELAVLLHLGANAVLSHESAAALWGIAPAAGEPVTATLIGRYAAGRPGLITHRVAALDPRDVRLRDGLGVTAPARTLIDRAATATLSDLERALTEARVQGLVCDGDLYAALDRSPGRSGGARLRGLLGAQAGPALTRSEAEDRLRALLTAAQLPLPQFNAPVHGQVVDALWPATGLVVEVDGYQFHGDRARFESDRRRDQILAAHGYTVIRVTWRQLTEEPLAVAARLAQALAIAEARSDHAASI